MGTGATFDREGNTEQWHQANEYNLLHGRTGEYGEVFYRSAFYSWYTEAVHDKGYGVSWSAAATFVALQISLLGDNGDLWRPLGALGGVLGHELADALVEFANAGNAGIFEHVFPELRTLYFEGLKGESPQAWDRRVLSREQAYIQQLYENQGIAVQGVLQVMASGSGLMPAPLDAFPFEGSIMSQRDRVSHGLKIGAGLSANPALLNQVLRLGRYGLKIPLAF